MTRNVLILGAGITGLSAGWKLLTASRDYTVTYIERDSVPGGLAKSIAWNGFTLDLGPHRFHTEIPEIRDFIQQFCESRMIRVRRSSRMYLNGRYISYPIQPLQTLRCLGFSRSLHFIGSALGTLWGQKAGAAESYEEYVCRYYGKTLYQAIFQPFAEKVWGLPPAQISAETARVRLRGENIWRTLLDSLLTREETYVAEFLYPPGGIGEIARQFAQEISGHGGVFLFDHTVRRIAIEQGQVRGIVAETPQGIQEIPCDLLLSTIPLPQLIANLSPPPPTEILESAAGLHFRALALLYLLFPAHYEIEDTWLYYPEKHVPFSRIYVPGNFAASPAKTTRTCLCAEYTCEVGDETWLASPETLARRCEATLLESGLIREPAVDSLVAHIPDGYPVYRVGYEKTLRQALDRLRSLKNCITAGRQGLFRHNNIDQALQMGLLAADSIQTRVGDFNRWYDEVSRFNDYRIVD